MAATRKHSKKARKGTAGTPKTAARKKATTARTKTSGRKKGLHLQPPTREHPVSTPTKRASSRTRAREAGHGIGPEGPQPHEEITPKTYGIALSEAAETGESPDARALVDAGVSHMPKPTGGKRKKPAPTKPTSVTPRRKKSS